MKNITNKTLATVLNCIPSGKENAITRRELVIKTGLTDRTVRNMISELITIHKVPICSHSNGKGYYIAGTVEDIRHCLNETRNRKMSLVEREFAYREILNCLEG